jgi:hypothetical protein
MRGVASAIKNSHDYYRLAVHLVIDRIGKTFGKGSVKAAIRFGVYARVKHQ